MKRIGNKVLIMVLVVLAVLAMAGGVLAYLFLATDVFKSNQQLFAKYLTQNMNGLETIGQFSTLDNLDEILKQNKYEENITISCSDADGEKLIGQITMDTQNDPINGKNYGIIGLLVDGLEKTLEVEYMKENDMYSLRFTNSVKQFLSLENKNLKQFAQDLGMDEDTINQIPDQIDFQEFSLEELKLTEAEKQAEIDKYLNLVYNNIAKEKYTKTNNAVITVNGNTITTDSYALTLNMEDLKNIAIALLKTLKEDEIVLSKLQILDEKIQEYSEEESIKDSFVEEIQLLIDGLSNEEVSEKTIIFTVYQQNKNTVRIKVEEGLNNVTLDTLTVDGKQQINVKFTSFDEVNTQLSYGIAFIRESDKKLTIEFISINGEEQKQATLTAEVIENENNIKIHTVFETEYLQLQFTREITIVDEINYAVTLDNSNNIVLNELSAEQIDNILDAVSGRLMTDYIEPAAEIAAPIMLMINASESLENADLSNAEKELFNMKFTNYEETRVSVAEVKNLLQTVAESNDLLQENDGFGTYINVTGDVTLEDYSLSLDQFKSQYYSIVCKKGEDGLVNEIVILEN